MSTTQLEFKFRVGGALTNATSVVLSNSAATYGVRRTDTLATVVAAGTAMVNASTGVYTYDVTDPAAGLTYQWVAKVVHAGATHYFTFTAAGGASDSPDGVLTSWPEFKTEIGKFNAEAASQLDGLSTPDLARVQEDIDDADAYARRRARLAGMTVADVLASEDVQLARRATSLYGAGLLVSHRQWFESNDATTQMMNSLFGRAEKMFTTLFGEDPGGIDGQPTEDPSPEVGTFSFVPINRGTGSCGDEYSSGCN